MRDAVADRASPPDAVPSCVVAGKTYADGASNPSNPCETCQVATSRTKFSDANGTGCVTADAGGLCARAACVVAQPACASGDAGVNNCGGNARSCCASTALTGGTYDRTYTSSSDGGTDGSSPATVGSFTLDTYLVTVGRFRQFVAAWNGGKGYTPPTGSGKQTQLNAGAGLNGAAGGNESGWVSADDTNLSPTEANLASCTPSTWTTLPASQETLPINCVNWYEAYAFCIWDGGFLPSEAEWELAAAGGAMQLEYPWGSTPPGTQSGFAIFGCHYHGSGTCTGVENIAPVGTPLVPSIDGQDDMAGDVSEWVLDWYSGYTSSCTDCAALTTASDRVIRGGAYDLPASAMLPATRAGQAPTTRSHDTGVRCARVP